MKKFKKHIFICENRRVDAISCSQKGSEQLRTKLKKIVETNGLKKIIRVNSAGCLGACDHGPVMVIYPQGVYYGGFDETDLAEIFEKSILKSEIIERLIIEE